MGELWDHDRIAMGVLSDGLLGVYRYTSMVSRLASLALNIRHSFVPIPELFRSILGEHQGYVTASGGQAPGHMRGNAVLN